MISPIPEPTNNKTLKNELAELFLEYEELANPIGPEIESKYILNFGFLEIELYELEIEIKKLKQSRHSC